MWRIFAKALGAKEGKHEKEADMVALVRTVILFSYMLTNFCIILGVARHWNDAPKDQSTCIQRSQALPYSASPTNQR
jgi:hypothetical protein